MENLHQDVLLLQSIRLVQNVTVNRDASSEPEQKQQTQLEAKGDQETAKPKGGPQSLPQIEIRIQKLKNRLLVLLKSQEYRQKAKENSQGTPDEGTNQDNGELCELEVIQKELQELQELKKTLDAKRGTSHPEENKGPSVPPRFLTDEPRSRIYLLPPIQSDQEVAAEAPRPTGPIVPVESLERDAEVTKCPSCEEVVLTETQSTVGEAMWIMCVLCSMLGCVAGCCLIPFSMKRLRTVSHHCPRCHKRIHTFRPF